MRRRHLVELEDLPWFPAILRDGGTAFLEFAARITGHSRGFLVPLERLLDATGETRIVDLCSGGGGPAAGLMQEMALRGRAVTVTLTDLYPNVPAFAYAAGASEGRITGHAEPVDAAAVPATLVGVRTLFNGFHHLQPELARRVLADAVRQRQAIGVFEIVSREWPMLLGILFTPVLVTLGLPFWRPFRWPWVLLTWVLPVMQGFVLWDGIVSWLRVYSVTELREMVAAIDTPEGWTWDIRTLRLGRSPAFGTYLIGYPAQNQPAEAAPIERLP